MVSDLIKNQYTRMREKMKKTYKTRAFDNQVFEYKLMFIDHFEKGRKWGDGLTK